ncbi:MAG: Ni/Fe-hydrogenase, b-type cytochrome subunit [SAR324 cluster bacterium]|nr:Ni/Fe-hydrogenase, b-type cytochrome subunit [SAR324 cluster bacterium]
MEQKGPSRVTFYVWQLPVRLFHWINALCIVLLIITGYLIGNPVALQNSQEAHMGHWFGTVRLIHFAAAYVFLFAWIYRIIYAFMGNQYARWTNYLPLSQKQWDEFKDVIAIDIFMMVEERKIHSPGHNSVACLSYLFLGLASVFQIASGFGLLAPMSEWWIADLFTWIVPMMDGDTNVRFWHHLMMWFFVIFTMVHVYIVAFHDYVEARGTTSSMIGGWKFVEEKDLQK